MKRLHRILAVVAVLHVGAACSDETTGVPTGPARAGTLFMHLTTPHADDGAVLFEITGPSIDSVTSVSGSLRLYTRPAGSTLVGVVIGTVAGGPVLKMWVPDVSGAEGYRVRVLDVADRHNVLRTSLENYAMTVTP